MNTEQLKNLLKTTNYPVAYRFFKTAQKAPYICFYGLGDNTFFADGKRYAAFKRYRIELYTNGKNETAESIVENALADFCFSKDGEDYIQTIDKTRTIYEIEV